MTPRVRYTYEQPVSAGFIDPAVFEQLARAFPHTTGADGIFTPRALNPKGSILKPVTESIKYCVTTDLGKQFTRIGYDVDNRQTKPGASQRDRGWHVDNNGPSQYVMVASSAIPTEFLVADDLSEEADMQRRHILNMLADEPDSTFNSEAIGTGVSEGLFRIYQPEPYEAVISTTQIHRSPKNMGKQAIERTFLRAWISAR